MVGGEREKLISQNLDSRDDIKSCPHKKPRKKMPPVIEWNNSTCVPLASTVGRHVIDNPRTVRRQNMGVGVCGKCCAVVVGNAVVRVIALMIADEAPIPAPARRGLLALLR